MNDLVLAASASYRAHSLAHGAATECGDYKKGNRHYDGIVKALHSLRKLGEPGELALLDLLGDPEAWVRCWAATHALVVDPARARLALEELASMKGIVALSARTVLDEFTKGTLKLP
ncbi:MAG: DUF2019 domain-containing protein [Myxococcales bacterium]|nr:DUF2019 domain-containing protein [Myxococcales bacterium]